MQIETVPIVQLHLDPANARRHPQRNLDAIMASLARFGQQKPIVVDANDVVRAGNGTLAAAKALGWTEVRVVRTALVAVEATAFGIADNRTAELAEWDESALVQILAEPGLGDVGFDEAEIRKLQGAPPPTESDGELTDQFHILVECKDETEQQKLYERLVGEGFNCRVLMA